jgi:hypothetical protein
LRNLGRAIRAGKAKKEKVSNRKEKTRRQPLARLWTHGLPRFVRGNRGEVKVLVFRRGEAPRHFRLVATRRAYRLVIKPGRPVVNNP